MKKSLIYFTLSILSVLIISCGSGTNSTSSINYYSASSAAYYQIESQSNESYLLNIVTSSGNKLSNVPLTMTDNGYSFATVINGNQVTGTIVLKNDLMGIAISNTGGSILSFADFATTPVNIGSAQIPNGNYTTVCDRGNISACVIKIANNQISITEYSTSGEPTVLCSNATMLKTHAGEINPYLSSFMCGVQGGTYTGYWYILPLLINGETGLMISEYNPNLNAPDSATDEIAFSQTSFLPNGTYNYVYSGISGNQAGITIATFTNNSLVNTVVGTCFGAPCALIDGQYFGSGMTNSMLGFSFYTVNELDSYNMVGSDNMHLYMDSFSGIYF